MRDAVIYTRFSPRRNAETCESCDVQEAVCEEFAAAHDMRVVARYRDEAVSGTVEIEDRNLHEAVKRLKPDHVLLVMKRDRLSRDMLIGLQIERVVEKRLAAVVCCQGEPYSSDPNATLLKHILMSVGEWERRMIIDRTKTAMRKYRQTGRRISKIIPYGWYEDPDDAAHLLPCRPEIDVLDKIWAMHKEGATLRKICASLDPDMARCGRWHPEVVRHLIARLKEDRMADNHTPTP